MSKKKKEGDALDHIRKRYKTAADAWRSQFEDSKADIRFGFVPGCQWDEIMAKARGKGRSKYEFNKVRPAVKDVTNDMRQNAPAIKIRATKDDGRELAETMQGLIRNIEAQSRADTAYDTAGFYSAAGGYGIFEITTEYADDDSFEQDIRIREKRNPFAFKCDPAAKEFDRRDARYWFEDYCIPREEFKNRYPDADYVDWNPSDVTVEKYGDWFTEKEVRIARYWCKHPVTKTIYKLSDGRVVDDDDFNALVAAGQVTPPQADSGGAAAAIPMQPGMLTVESTRVVKSHRIEVSVVSGAEVLEGPTPWAGKFIPIIPVWGDTVNLDGEELFSGIIRPAKDAQKLFNWNVCTGQEILAKQPISPFLVTPAMIQGHEQAWEGLAVDNAPALLYNVDASAPGGGMPQRQPPPSFPGAMFQGAQFSADLLKSVTGVVDGPVQSKASSGKAILAVEHQGDVANFDYIDNLARAKAYAGEILVDLIPRIYTNEREVMILGTDGKESYVQLNQTVQGPDGTPQVINDLSQGKYAVAVTVGPSFATQRMETFDAMREASNSPNPMVAALATYGMFKNMDAPGMEEITKATRQLLIAQKLLEPGEGDTPPPQQGPNPLQLAEVQAKQAQAQKALADAADTRVDTAIKVQHAPMQAVQEAARTDQAVTSGYTANPTTPYFGPPNQNQAEPGLTS